MKYLVFLILSLLVLGTIRADVYMHNPRGSNNRNCERNANRNNANRLFDSQNNAAGGYACPRAVGGPEVVTPRMYYYVGSVLQVQWTSQHSCGLGNNHCQIVLQYACEDTLPGVRDGTPTNLNDDATATIDQANEFNPRFGSHEPRAFYNKCATRLRNKNLFSADRVQNNPDARATVTRQDDSGQRYGWECPEERDYYPYWHPTPWKDIAIFTSNTSMCEYYQKNSENVLGRGECMKDNVPQKANNPADCGTAGGNWVTNSSWSLPPPECLSTDAIIARDNSLGSGNNGQIASYNWVIPDTPSQACVLRLRYNISTADFDPWRTDAKFNLAASPLNNNYRHLDWGLGSWVSLKMNTDQYGRTFQDRSYVFEIRKRPNDVPAWKRIWNLNVRGKRGNIVQTFPSTEYDFVPTNLVVSGGDLVHFQWTGSDYNPARNPNDAEGGPEDPATPGQDQRRADRNNVVQIDFQGANYPRPAQYNTMFLDKNGKPDMEAITKMALIGQPINGTALASDPKVGCLPAHIVNTLNNADSHPQNCGKLNGAKTPYFDGGLVEMRATGTFHYMSSRNNNFSNRSQKGKITVQGGWFSAGSRTTSSSILAVMMIFVALFLVL